MDPTMSSTEFGYSTAMPTSWMTTSDGTAAHIPAGYHPANWEEWMRWDASQVPPQSPKQSTSQPGPNSTTASADSLAARRQHPLPRDMNLQLNAQSIGHPMPTTTTTTAMAFAFGTATTDTPSFHFNSIGNQISPTDSIGHEGAEEAHWSGQESDNALVSPDLANGQYSGLPLPPAEQMRRNSSYSTHVGGSSKSPQTSPEPRSAGAGKKRKSPDEDDDNTASQKNGKGPKKTSHNMIEKRYRTNLNDKIAALRDSVPSLRVMSRSTINGDDDDEEEDLEGLAPAHKLNKATVLSKATEYIRHLEKRCKKQGDEITMLKSRLEQLEKMVLTGPMLAPSAVSTPDGMRYQEEMYPRTPGPPVSQPAQGLIPIPDSIANLRRAQMHQASYATPPNYPAYSHGPPPSNRGAAQGMVNGGRHSNVMSRLMVGSLAGLMLMEGFSRREAADGDVESRGLFALPVGMFGQIGSPQHHSAANLFLSSLKPLLVFSAFIYVISPLLSFKPKPKKKAATVRLAPAPSLASPVELRQKAWLTAIQTVWVPRHNFLLEVAALILKTLKLSTRTLIGWKGYAFLTGITKEQEAARVKAWEIALDAQLTGGDAEISMSRLVLSLLASGTLPDTPARLMLKALHIRVIFWEFAKLGYGTWYMVDEISFKLARRYWNAARIEQQARCNRFASPEDDSTPLPDHLVALLQLDADDVLIDPIIQRVYNLAWNRPGSQTAGVEDSMDSVVEDFAIASPLDALAAWWSSFVTNRVLAHSLEQLLPDERDALPADLNLALSTAPPNSFASMRAHVALAVLANEETRANHIANALAILPPDASTAACRATSPASMLISVIDSNSLPADVRTALTLVKCLDLSTSSGQTGPLRAAAGVNGFFPTSTSYTLLSFVAALAVFEAFVAGSASLRSDARPGLERLASTLRIWVGTESGRKAEVGSKARTRIVQTCLALGKALIGIEKAEDESDAGYVSMSERALSEQSCEQSIDYTSTF